MTWLSWRQLRLAALISCAVLLAAGVMWVATGLQLRSAGNVVYSFRLVQLINTTMVAVPALVGAFWGAPLVAREYETGTYRLAWTQSVTPDRWLANKLVVVGGCGLLLTGLATLGVDWWSAPIDAAAGNKFTPALFSVRGVVPLSYTAFAFALGVVCGSLLRKTLPAMAATLAGFTVVRLVVTLWVRPHFATPVTSVIPPSVVPANGPPVVNGSSITESGGWVLSDRLSGTGGSLREVITSQPLDRFWAFQWWESGLFVTLAGALTLLAFHRIHRRAG